MCNRTQKYRNVFFLLLHNFNWQAVTKKDLVNIYEVLIALNEKAHFHFYFTKHFHTLHCFHSNFFMYVLTLKLTNDNHTECHTMLYTN